MYNAAWTMYMIVSTENIPKSLHIIYLFLWLALMNTCKYPDIKFISSLIFGQYQMRIKKIMKIKTCSYLPTQTFFRRLPETYILFF